MWFYDPAYFLVILGAFISIIATVVLRLVFLMYSRKTVSGNVTANQVANTLLRNEGIDDVCTGRISGHLTDHYNPSTKELRLSDSTYGSSSVAAIGVAAHECGHAIQHAQGYWPLHLRSLAVPIANIGSWCSWPVIVLGILVGSQQFAEIGIYLFLFVIGFQLITLPVEFNASRRAVKALRSNGIMTEEELHGVKAVLFAAALTYVAALASSFLQLFRLMLIVASIGGRRK